MTFGMPTLRSPSLNYGRLLRLQKQIDDGDEDDAAAHDQGVVLHGAALHSAEEARAAARRVGDAVDEAVDDVLVEQVRAVPEREDGDVPGQVDQAVDDPDVEPPEETGQEQRARDGGGGVDLVDVVLVDERPWQPGSAR